jgi:hypothetical protein
MTDTTRKIGWGLAALMVAGNMIGSGVYLLPATLAPIGSSSLIGWIVASIGALSCWRACSPGWLANPPARRRADGICRRRSGPLFRLSGVARLLGRQLDRQRRHRPGRDRLSGALLSGACASSGRGRCVPSA